MGPKKSVMNPKNRGRKSRDTVPWRLRKIFFAPSAPRLPNTQYWLSAVPCLWPPDWWAGACPLSSDRSQLPRAWNAWGRAAAAGTRPRPPAPRWWQPGGSLRTGTPAPGRTQIGPDTGPADHLRATKNKPISDSLYDSLSVIPLKHFVTINLSFLYFFRFWGHTKL